MKRYYPRISQDAIIIGEIRLYNKEHNEIDYLSVVYGFGEFDACILRLDEIGAGYWDYIPDQFVAVEPTISFKVDEIRESHKLRTILGISKAMINDPEELHMNDTVPFTSFALRRITAKHENYKEKYRLFKEGAK